jgi:small subunit ribosomal protein S16
MSVVKIRLARGGAKKRPHYSIVVANATAPRDGNFIEKVGHYNPMLSHDHPERVVIKLDRVDHWIGKGAQPTERVAHFIDIKGGALTEKIRAKMNEKVQKRVPRAPRKQDKA